MSEHGENNGDSDRSHPEWETVHPDHRVADSDWDALVADIGASTAYNSEISADDVANYLDAQDNWDGPRVERIDWANVAPAHVLTLGALIAGITLLITAAVFFRPVPGWVVITGITMAVGGGIGAVFILPRSRRDDDSGAQV